MNLPNRLTVTRLVMTPLFFVIFFLVDLFPSFNPVLYAVLLVLFYGIMELTDLLDGKIARKHGLVTDLGKVLDPFADVICHLTFFACFLAAGIMPVWAFIPILWREFSQSFTRMLMMGKGKAMAANTSLCSLNYVVKDSGRTYEKINGGDIPAQTFSSFSYLHKGVDLESHNSSK